MRKFAMAVALMCALSTSIFAGDMPTGGKSEPPPPPMTRPSASSTLLLNVVLTIISLR